MRSTVTTGSEIELTAPVDPSTFCSCSGVRPCSLAFAASAAAPSAAFMVTVTVRGGGGGDAVTVMSSAVNGSPRNVASAAA